MLMRLSRQHLPRKARLGRKFQVSAVAIRKSRDEIRKSSLSSFSVVVSREGGLLLPELFEVSMKFQKLSSISKA